MQILRSCLTCKFHGAPVSQFDPKKESRPCEVCILTPGFSKWECAEQYNNEDNYVV